MFLLNGLIEATVARQDGFTIQNVSIKFRKTTLKEKISAYLQYKMFLLNLDLD